jgi:hypothetical protein
VPEAVVRLPLGGVLEDLVALLDRRELRGGVRVVVEVGMVLPHLRPERVLDLLLARVLANLEEVVEVEVVGHVVRAVLIGRMGLGFIFAMLSVVLEVRQGSLAR